MTEENTKKKSKVWTTVKWVFGIFVVANVLMYFFGLQ